MPKSAQYSGKASLTMLHPDVTKACVKVSICCFEPQALTESPTTLHTFASAKSIQIPKTSKNWWPSNPLWGPHMHYPSTVDHFVDHDGSKYLSPLPFRCYSVHAFVVFNSVDIPSIKTKILSFQHPEPSSTFIDLHRPSWSCHGLVMVLFHIMVLSSPVPVALWPSQPLGNGEDPEVPSRHWTHWKGHMEGAVCRWLGKIPAGLMFFWVAHSAAEKLRLTSLHEASLRLQYMFILDY